MPDESGFFYCRKFFHFRLNFSELKISNKNQPCKQEKQTCEAFVSGPVFLFFQPVSPFISEN